MLVRTQKELDEAIRVGKWIEVDSTWKGNSHVVAWGNSHVEARDFTTIIKYSDDVKIRSGSKATVIAPDYPSDPTEWARLKGIPIRHGRITLWKAVREDYTAFHDAKTLYEVGNTAEAPDWEPNLGVECGFALHLADSPSGARYFVPAEARDSFRLLKVSAAIEDCRCFPGLPDYPMKLRARACRVLREYPRDFEPVPRGW